MLSIFLVAYPCVFSYACYVCPAMITISLVGADVEVRENVEPARGHATDARDRR